jgi:glutamate-1-semialdehyde 2,1-aminomutase
MAHRPSTKHPRSVRLFDRAQRVIPGGVDSPVRAFKAVGGTPLFIRSASGAHITDVDGRTYIDYVMSWGPLIHGHAPGGLVKAIAAAARHGTSFGAPTALEVELAELVRSMMPALELIRFVSSGTEATMSAIRVARAHTRREKIIKFEGCYHGHADQFLVQAGSGLTTLGTPTSPGVTRSSASDTLLAAYNDLPSVERLCEAFPDQIAALIVEPIAGNMGMVLPDSRFLQGLRDTCTRYRILLVFDEVITGFRVGPGGAQGWSGVAPDLTCLGKIIGGGLPVGAYGGREELMRMVSPSGPVYQAGTLSGNPLAMTAGLWSLNGLTSGLYSHLSRLGAVLADGLADAARRAGVALQVNGLGSALTPFFTSTAVRNYQSALKADAARYGAFFKGMLARGVYPPPSQFEAWFLSGAHTEKDVQKTIRAAREAMREVAKLG